MTLRIGEKFGTNNYLNDILFDFVVKHMVKYVYENKKLFRIITIYDKIIENCLQKMLKTKS